MSFADTENKAAIRRQWDRALLLWWMHKLKRPLLTYFGLPGPEVRDLLDWRTLLDRRRTGVESIGHTKREQMRAQDEMGRLTTNLFIAGISSGFQLLRGDVEDVILDGLDYDGSRPQINDGRPAHAALFGYDLVNLDFDGGLGYRDGSGAAKRVAALKKLFERQEGHSFLLFLTINVRDTMGSEIEHYLRGLRTRERGPGWQQALDWYLSRSDGEREYKLKAAVPSFIQTIAEARVFRCTSRPPIAYEGHERAHMIHFTFELEAVALDGRPANLRGFSPQDDLDLIELPLIRCQGGQLQLAARQHDGFNAACCAASIDFLPEEIRVTMLPALTENPIRS
jgi:hypothetical protein